MPYSYNKLRGRVIEKYGTQDGFAKALDTSKQVVSMKMTGKTNFSQKDILAWCELLDIQPDQISEYFFA